MNVARAMGNRLDPKYVVELIRAFNENTDERVKCMCVWALGRIGSSVAIEALKGFMNQRSTKIQEEIDFALANNT